MRSVVSTSIMNRKITIIVILILCIFFFQAEDGIRDVAVTGVQTCALPISLPDPVREAIWLEVGGDGPPRLRPLIPFLLSWFVGANRGTLRLPSAVARLHIGQIGRASCRERV